MVDTVARAGDDFFNFPALGRSREGTGLLAISRHTFVLNGTLSKEQGNGLIVLAVIRL